MIYERTNIILHPSIRCWSRVFPIPVCLMLMSCKPIFRSKLSIKGCFAFGVVHILCSSGTRSRAKTPSYPSLFILFIFVLFRAKLRFVYLRSCFSLFFPYYGFALLCFSFIVFFPYYVFFLIMFFLIVFFSCYFFPHYVFSSLGFFLIIYFFLMRLFSHFFLYIFLAFRKFSIHLYVGCFSESRTNMLTKVTLKLILGNIRSERSWKTVVNVKRRVVTSPPKCSLQRVEDFAGLGQRFPLHLRPCTPLHPLSEGFPFRLKPYASRPGRSLKWKDFQNDPVSFFISALFPLDGNVPYPSWVPTYLIYVQIHIFIIHMYD